MKRSTKIITAVVLTFGIAGGAVAYGKAKWADPEARANHMTEFVTEKLNLDGTQEQHLVALKEQILETRKLVRSEMKPMRHNISELVSADTFDQGKALQMLNQKTNLMNENAPAVIAAFGTFLDSLNAEQKAEVIEFMERKRGRHGWKK